MLTTDQCFMTILSRMEYWLAATSAVWDCPDAVEIVEAGAQVRRLRRPALLIKSLKEARPAHFDKRVTGRFLVEQMLPETALHPRRIRLDAGNVMELPAEAFYGRDEGCRKPKRRPDA